jgi:signal transduction histidine kinase
VLGEYLRTRSEAVLYRASLLSQHYVEAGLGPDEIIALHFEALDQTLTSISPREQVHAISDAHQFLLEVMITYGVKYREYLDLRLRESLREAEERATHDRERALELERLQQEKNELLAMIAHELRTPLAGAKGAVDMAQRRLAQGETERLTALLASAGEALNRLSRLTADLMQASQGGLPSLDRSPQDLGAIVVQAYTWAQATAAAKGVVLRLVAIAAGARVFGNADALLSVVGNLLANAIRYTPAGGRVTVQVDVEDSNATAVVIDTGIGMTPAVRARIFEKFYRAPEARQHEAQGLGLGLALVQQMVLAHGGQIEVESTPGAGSTFRVVLPLMPEGAEERNDG